MGCPSPVTKGFFKDTDPQLRASLNPWFQRASPAVDTRSIDFPTAWRPSGSGF